MYPDLFEQPPMHHRHHPTAAGRPVMADAPPGRAHEARGLIRIERRRRLVLELFEGRANLVAQGLEPGGCARLAILDVGFRGQSPKSKAKSTAEVPSRSRSFGDRTSRNARGTP